MRSGKEKINMSKTIAIMGESGAGKTTAMRTLNPAETFYIDCDKKGLSWKGWKEQYNGEKRNYLKTSLPSEIRQSMQVAHKNESYRHIKNIVIDTINGVMIDDEMARAKEKTYDKWVDLAQSVWDIVSEASMLRDDLNVIFIAHSETDRDDNGYNFTRIKTNGKKLNKIVLESKFNTVLFAKCVEGRYLFETRAKNSTAKTPLGCFDNFEIDNDMNEVLKALEDY